MTDKQLPTQHDIVRQDAERRNRVSHRWEHMQIDIPDDLEENTTIVVYTFVEPLIDLIAEVRGGVIIDFKLVPEVSTNIELIPPPFNLTSDTSSEASEHSPIFRSWNVPQYRLTIHVESWVEKDGGGFVDVFGKRG
ncbi:MAG: hypothetical protein AB7H80_07835 [Candidatus Kapaibacterium sp.]